MFSSEWKLRSPLAFATQKGQAQTQVVAQLLGRFPWLFFKAVGQILEGGCGLDLLFSFPLCHQT